MLNPFTYRGYYYDADLNLYYLNSRYYDQNTRRFINEDSALYHSMFGYNMFAYCENNPVNYKDYTGENATEALAWWTSVFGTAAVAEPTFIGELIFALGVAFICGVVAYEGESFVKDVTEPVEVGNNSPSTDDSPKVEEPPQSVPEAGDEKDPSNPGKMQKEVD